MTATTSKLGADMTDDQLSDAYKQACEWTDDWSERQEREPSKEQSDAMFVRNLTELLARQPAVIDREAVAQWQSRVILNGGRFDHWNNIDAEGAEILLRDYGDMYEVRALYAAPLDKGASKPAAPSVEQDERGAFEYAARRLGADLSQTNGIYHDESTQRLRMMWHTAATFCGKARAASTSANVAQGAETVIPGTKTFYVECHECAECGHIGINDSHPTDASCGYSCGWTGPSPIEDNCPGCQRDGVMGLACPKCSGRYSILAEAHIPVAAPPAQTALTDDARDAAAAKWATSNTPIREALAFIDGFDAARALTAAQSASGDTK